MKPKTYSLTPEITEKIEEIQIQTKKTGLNLDASTIVRLALTEGLPKVTELLSLEIPKGDNQRQIALV